jgi:hypothetical protein
MKKWANELKQRFFKGRNVQNHVKKCSTSLAIKEMQIKTTVRFHLTPVRMLPPRIQTTANVGEDVKKRNPHTLLVEM